MNDQLISELQSLPTGALAQFISQVGDPRLKALAGRIYQSRVTMNGGGAGGLPPVRDGAFDGSSLPTDNPVVRGFINGGGSQTPAAQRLSDLADASTIPRAGEDLSAPSPIRSPAVNLGSNMAQSAADANRSATWPGAYNASGMEDRTSLGAPGVSGGGLAAPPASGGLAGYRAAPGAQAGQSAPMAQASMPPPAPVSGNQFMDESGGLSGASTPITPPPASAARGGMMTLEDHRSAPAFTDPGAPGYTSMQAVQDRQMAQSMVKQAAGVDQEAEDAPNWSMPFMMAGLAMMSSNNPSALGAMGEGGLAGLKMAMGAKQQRDRRDARLRERGEDRQDREREIAARSTDARLGRESRESIATRRLAAAEREAANERVRVFDPNNPTRTQMVPRGSGLYRKRVDEQGWVEGTPPSKSPGSIVNLKSPDNSIRGYYANSDEARAAIETGAIRDDGMDPVKRLVRDAIAGMGQPAPPSEQSAPATAPGAERPAAPPAFASPPADGVSLDGAPPEIIGTLEDAADALRGAPDQEIKIRQRLASAGIDPSWFDLYLRSRSAK